MAQTKLTQLRKSLSSRELTDTRQVENFVAGYDFGLHHYNQHVDAIRRVLKDAVKRETIEALLYDLHGVVTSGRPLSARPEQVREILDALTYDTAANIDRYGLFAGVIVRYRFYYDTLQDYLDEVRGGGLGKRRKYFTAITSSSRPVVELTAAALDWIRFTGEIRVTDFAGMEAGEIAVFLDYLSRYGQLADWLQYVYFLKNVTLSGQPEKLKFIPFPAIYANIDEALSHASLYASELGIFVRLVERGAIGNGDNGDTWKSLSLAPAFVSFNSRDPWAYKTQQDGSPSKEISPLQVAIENYCRKNPGRLPVSPYVAQRAAMGVYLLHLFRRASPANGIYTYETNLSELAEFCYPKNSDVSDNEKQNLLTSLLVLDNLFCVIWTAKGPVAQRLFAVESFDKTDVRLHVFEAALRGRPYFVSKSEFLQMTGKGQSENHFKNQILGKSHKERDALVREVFSYASALEMANRSGEESQVKAVREYQRKHLSRDRIRLERMFAKAAKNGFISYTLTENAAGEWVYSWKRLRVPTASELTEAQGPDEQ